MVALKIRRHMLSRNLTQHPNFRRGGGGTNGKSRATYIILPRPFPLYFVLIKQNNTNEIDSPAGLILEFMVEGTITWSRCELASESKVIRKWNKCLKRVIF